MTTPTSQQQATRAAIVAAVRAFVEQVERQAFFDLRIGIWTDEVVRMDDIRAELAALERTVADQDEPAERLCQQTYTATDGHVSPCVLPARHGTVHSWAPRTRKALERTVAADEGEGA